jgi:hypothetical protein
MAIPSESVESRVSILKRFRKLLVEQREKFQSYLDALDTQKKIIAQGSVDELVAHVELEEKIVAGISAIEKCIAPARAIYETVWAGKLSPEIPELNVALDSMKLEAARRISENKELLQTRMGALRGELKNLRSNPFARNRRSVYADSGQASLLDIKG